MKSRDLKLEKQFLIPCLLFSFSIKIVYSDMREGVKIHVTMTNNNSTFKYIVGTLRTIAVYPARKVPMTPTYDGKFSKES